MKNLVIRHLYLSVFCFLLQLSLPLQAQGTRFVPSQVNAGFGVYKLGIPGSDLVAFPAHTSISLAANWHPSKQASSWSPELGLNYYNSHSSGPGYFIDFGYGPQVKLASVFTLQVKLNFSIHHHFNAKQVLKLVNGQYQAVRDNGIIRPGSNLRLNLGYSLGRGSVYASYLFGAEFGYSPDIPMLPINLLQLGLQYEIR